MAGLKVYTHPKGAQVKIFYLNSPEDTFNQANLDSQIDDIYDHTRKFDGNLFTGLTIEIYDYRLPSIPKNTYDCTSTLCKVKTMGIGNYAGLTTGQLRIIQLNSSCIQSKQDLAECFSHEWGHYKAYVMGWNNLNSFLRKFWNAIRGKHATLTTSVGELIAEDLREDEGATCAIGVERTDVYNYIQADKVQGLKDLYAIWKLADEFINEFYKNNHPTMITRITDPLFAFSNDDFDYIEINFAEINCVFQFLNRVYKINRNGIFRNGTCLKSFL
jgi:hypothetical protein